MEDRGADVKNLHALCFLAPAEKQMMLKYIVHCGKLSILQVIGVARYQVSIKSTLMSNLSSYRKIRCQGDKYTCV